MKRRTKSTKLVEALATHADHLNREGMDSARHETMDHTQSKEFLSLATLAEQVKGTLAPVAPPSSRRQKLKSDLTGLVRQLTSREILIAKTAQGGQWVLGVAIGSAVALAGGVAYLLRTYAQIRSRRTSGTGTQPAANRTRS